VSASPGGETKRTLGTCGAKDPEVDRWVEGENAHIFYIIYIIYYMHRKSAKHGFLYTSKDWNMTINEIMRRSAS
jgi:hypothetical protein